MEAVLSFSSIFLWIIALLNLILTLALVRRVNYLSQFSLPQPLERLKDGEIAPDFVANTLEDKNVTLANYAGQHLVLFFISLTCSACKTHISLLASIYPRIVKAGFTLALVSFSDASSTSIFLEDFDSSLPVLIAPRETNHFAEDYKIRGTPWYYIINKEGKVEAGGPADASWNQYTDKWAAERGSSITN